MKSLGQRFRGKRLKYNLTHQRLSQLTKFSKSFFKQIEREVVQPTIGKDR